MRIFFDTEFYEDGKSIHPISIGLVNGVGDVYYAEFKGASRLCNKLEWLKENVSPHLRGPEKTASSIAEDIMEFVSKDGTDPEFWAYFASYDWVMLCQLYGSMMKLPKGWPQRCNDIAQLFGMTPVHLRAQIIRPENPQAHNALADAIWAKDFFAAIATVITHRSRK